MKAYINILFFSFLLANIGCDKMAFVAEPETDSESLFDEFWGTYNRDYAVFQQRGVNWQEQFDLYRDKVDVNTSEDQLADIFKLMLAELDDGHVSLTMPDVPTFYANKILRDEIDDELFDLALIRQKYLGNDYTVNGYDGNTFGWIGEIGYWHMDFTSDNWPEVGGILDKFENAKGLIIDLRHNGGGDFTWMINNFGRFTNQKRLVFSSRTKNGPDADDFTEWHDWYVTPAESYFDKPIVLLTDRYTISAGERAVLAFKTLPNVTHLGEPTNGAISTKIHKELPNGWNYSVSTQQVRFINGEIYEGPGIPPDILVKNTYDEIDMGVDMMLEKALETF